MMEPDDHAEEGRGILTNDEEEYEDEYDEESPSCVEIGSSVPPPSKGTSTAKKIEPLEIDSALESGEDRESLLSSPDGENADGDEEGGDVPGHAQQGAPRQYLNGVITALPVGNMLILFPEQFNTSGWGVLGPHPIGPVCVWGILVVATHFCARRAETVGIGSVLTCYLFFGWCTYLLTDVSLRDPSICFYKEIPETIPPNEARLWRFCEICQVFQPPHAAHCAECNVCVAGYDHYCVWMGTCIGRRNYRQFVRFNVSWLYYLGYVLVWVLFLGPLIFHH